MTDQIQQLNNQGEYIPKANDIYWLNDLKEAKKKFDKVYERAYKSGRLALKSLQKLSGFIDIKCLVCRKDAESKDEAEFIKDNNMCLKCEHVNGEQYDN